MYVLLVFSSQRFLNYFLVEYVLSKSVGVSFAYEFRVFAVKNFKSLLLLLDTSDTKTAHKRSAYLEEEEEDKKEEDKTGVSIFALFFYFCL
jgi:hypothetical protein